MQIESVGLAGIGIGPFNLSLAALLSPLGDLRWRFFERRPSFDWQSGMMLPGTRMQTSFLKDLVTPVDPTSPYGFLSYLVSKGRFYRFLNAEYSRVMRGEFADYMRWVAEQLPSLEFGADVREVSFDGDAFRLSFEQRPTVSARHLVLATGASPAIPSWAERHLGGLCFHSGGYMRNELGVAGQRVLIVGGGQSGAEIFLDVCSGRRGHASQVTWVSRRPNLDPLDETAFVNEYFTPEYVGQFFRLSEEQRARVVESQKLAGDGVSPHTLNELSQFMYDNDFLRGQRRNYRILTRRDVRDMARVAGAFRLEVHNGFDLKHESLLADVVILATGYRYTLPSCLGPLAGMLERDRQQHLVLEQDYRARWSGPARNRIYVQNGGRYSHGIADPQLSLAAWRSAVIVNSLAGREVYRTEVERPPVQWHSSQPLAAEREATRARGGIEV